MFTKAGTLCSPASRRERFRFPTPRRTRCAIQPDPGFGSEEADQSCCAQFANQILDRKVHFPKQSHRAMRCALLPLAVHQFLPRVSLVWPRDK